MTFFDALDGTRLAYHLDGEGKPLICLPGGPMQASAYLGELGGLSAFDARMVEQLNLAAMPIYYSDGAIDTSMVRSAVANLPAPVLLIAGEYDPGLPPERAEEYAALFRNARLAVAPRGGHFPWLDDHEWFVRTVTDFLR